MERICINEVDKIYPNGKLITSGSEAAIINLDGYAYKLFLSDDIKTAKRKERILLDLEKKTYLHPYFPKLYSLVEAESREYIKGYIMELINKFYGDFDIHERMNFLKQLKEILGLFSKAGYLYLDVRNPNVVISRSKSPILLDIDGIVPLDSLECGCIPSDVKDYITYGGKIGTNAQIFMFNKAARTILGLEPRYGDGDEILFDDEPILETKPITETDELVLDKIGTQILYELLNRAPIPDMAYDNEYLHEHVKIK